MRLFHACCFNKVRIISGIIYLSRDKMGKLNSWLYTSKDVDSKQIFDELCGIYEGHPIRSDNDPIKQTLFL